MTRRSTLATIAAALTVLTACGGLSLPLPLPDLALATWFGDDDGVIEGDATEGEFVVDLGSELTDRGDVEGLGRGGLTLAGLSVDEGTLTPTGLELVVTEPAQMAEPAFVGVRVYVSRTPLEPPFWDQEARVLLGARIPVTFDEELEGYRFAGDFEILRKNDDLIEAVANAETVYVALVARVFDAEDNRIGRSFRIRMTGLVATPRLEATP